MNLYLSKMLKQIRIENHLTQKQLAERLGLAKSVISYYESGERLPSLDVLIRFSKTFHVSVDVLLGIERNRTLDVSDLSESDIQVLNIVANALRDKAR